MGLFDLTNFEIVPIKYGAAAEIQGAGSRNLAPLGNGSMGLSLSTSLELLSGSRRRGSGGSIVSGRAVPASAGPGPVSGPFDQFRRDPVACRQAFRPLRPRRDAPACRVFLCGRVGRCVRGAPGKAMKRHACRVLCTVLLAAAVLAGIGGDVWAQTVTLTMSPATIDESGTSNSITVTASMDTAAAADVTVVFSATAGITLSSNTLPTITAGAKASTGTVTLNPPARYLANSTAQNTTRSAVCSMKTPPTSSWLAPSAQIRSDRHHA